MKERKKTAYLTKKIMYFSVYFSNNSNNQIRIIKSLLKIVDIAYLSTDNQI